MPSGCVIGVDVGGTKLLAGTVDADLRVHHRAWRRSRGVGQAEVLATIEDAVREALDATEEPVLGVGIGVPATIDTARGVAVECPHLPLAGVAVGDLMAERLGLPVAVDNDANLAALAEHRRGAAEGTRNAVVLTLGTGIGGGLILDGALFRGSTGAAGELGHLPISEDGPPCPSQCPHHGCLESFASGTALERDAALLAAERPDSGLGRALAAGREITGPLVTELAHDGDVAACEALTTLGRHLGTGIAGFVNALDPDIVVVGGGVIGAGELILGPARQEMRSRALAPARDRVRIEAARFGGESGMLGAALLALDGHAP